MGEWLLYGAIVIVLPAVIAVIYYVVSAVWEERDIRQSERDYELMVQQREWRERKKQYGRFR